MLSAVPKPIRHKTEARGLRYSVLQINRGASEVTALQFPSSIAQRQLRHIVLPINSVRLCRGKADRNVLSQRDIVMDFTCMAIHMRYQLSVGIYTKTSQHKNVGEKISSYFLRFATLAHTNAFPRKYLAYVALLRRNIPLTEPTSASRYRNIAPAAS